MKRFVVFALLFVLLLLFGLLLLALILMHSANSPEIAQEPSLSPPQLSASPPQTEQPHLTRPPQIDQVVELLQGVTYTRDARQTPRPLMVLWITPLPRTLSWTGAEFYHQLRAALTLSLMS
jgi:hypothetical protein